MILQRKHALKGILVLACLLFVSISNVAASRYDIERELKDLDDAVAQYPVNEQKQFDEIERKKNDLKTASLDNERYYIMKQIHSKYKRLNSDSALFYIEKCLKLAEKHDRTDWYKESILARAELYIFRGNLFLAREDFRLVGDIDSLPEPLKMKCAMILCSFYRNFQKNKVYKNSEYHAEILRSMNVDWQSLPEKHLKNNPLNYYRTRYYVGIIDTAKIETIKKIFDQNYKKGDTNVLGYVLAQLYRIKGDSCAYKYYLIKTAERHVRNVFKCSDSVLELLSSDWLLNNPERAYNYVKLFASDVSFFHDENHSVALVATQNKIVERFFEVEDNLYMKLAIAFVITLLFLILSVVLTVKLHHRVTRINELNGIIDRRNKSLSKNLEEIENISAELKASNARLQDELKLRDGNFMDTYLMCSDNIKIHLNFKKTITNLLKTNSIQKALKVASSRDISESELKEFYIKFDKAFLSTHPDFIERFNSILRPEHRFSINDDKELTPELRIYALISLGINNSVSIADFLHYSAQTIYNYRLRMRHQACIPERVFAEAVGHLYEDDKLKEYLSMKE